MSIGLIIYLSGVVGAWVAEGYSVWAHGVPYDNTRAFWKHSVPNGHSQSIKPHNLRGALVVGFATALAWPALYGFLTIALVYIELSDWIKAGNRKD